MTETVLALLQNPGESPSEIRFRKAESLEQLQGAVGGYITTVYHPGLDEEGITLWVNDEGLILGQEPNLVLSRQPIVGPVVFTGHNDEGETIGLTDAQVTLCRGFLMGVSLNEEDRARIKSLLVPFV